MFDKHYVNLKDIKMSKKTTKIRPTIEELEKSGFKQAIDKQHNLNFPEHWVNNKGEVWHWKLNKYSSKETTSGTSHFLHRFYPDGTMDRRSVSVVVRQLFSIDLSKFVSIPEYENEYLINEDGEIYSLILGLLKKPTINHVGYYKVVLTKNKIHKTWLLHHLILKTFKPEEYKKLKDSLDNYVSKKNLKETDKFKERLTVDHINGIKTDNRLENLEVVTTGENTRRAYKNGLTTCNKPIKLRNYFTGEERQYISYKSAHKEMGSDLMVASEGTISDVLSRPNHDETLFGGKWQIKHQNDITPWPKPTNSIGTGDGLHVLDYKINPPLEAFFPSLEQYCNYTGINYNTVLAALKEQKQVFLGNLHRVKKLDSDNWEKHNDPLLELDTNKLIQGRVYVLFKSGELPIVILPNTRNSKNKFNLSKSELLNLSKSRKNYQNYVVLTWSDYIKTDHYYKFKSKYEIDYTVFDQTKLRKIDPFEFAKI